MRKFEACIGMIDVFLKCDAQTIFDLSRENQAIEDLFFHQYVVKEDFADGGDYNFLKKTLEDDDTKLLNLFEIIMIFGEGIDIKTIKPRHFINITNYVRELCDFPMVSCFCGKSRQQCLLKDQIETYNDQLLKKCQE